MNMNHFESNLRNLVLAPYISKATALIGIRRKIGGNAFRHQMATLSILLDYKYDDSILLKASVIHDLLEDIPSTNVPELRSIDPESNMVIDLVLEVTRKSGEFKTDYLKRIVKRGSWRAKVLKVADRIGNVIDLTSDVYSTEKMKAYLKQTSTFILPIAQEVNQNMFIELKDLIERKHALHA